MGGPSPQPTLQEVLSHLWGPGCSPPPKVLQESSYAQQLASLELKPGSHQHFRVPLGPSLGDNLTEN